MATTHPWADLLDAEVFRAKLRAVLDYKNRVLTGLYGLDPLDFDGRSVFELCSTEPSHVRAPAVRERIIHVPGAQVELRARHVRGAVRCRRDAIADPPRGGVADRRCERHHARQLPDARCVRLTARRHPGSDQPES